MDIPRPDAQRRKLRRHALRWTLVAGLLAGTTTAVASLGTAPPRVGRSLLAVDTVRRGPFVREVRGRGALVAERSRSVSAPAKATVKRALAAPGAVLAAGDPIAQLVSPERDEQEADAEHALQVAQGEQREATRHLRAAADKQTLALHAADEELRAAVELMRAAEESADDRAEIERDLELCRRAKAHQAAERRRLALLRRSVQSLGAGQRARIAELQEALRQQRAAVAEMLVRAPVAGVVAEVHVRPGDRVEAGGLLAEMADPARLQARLRLPAGVADEIRTGQSAAVDTQSAVVPGRVVRVGREPAGAEVLVALDGTLPRDAQPDLRVEGVIAVEVAGDVLQVGRPSLASGDRTVDLFKLAGRSARRVPVRIGRASGESVEVLGGLTAGDQVILSDMSAWDGYDTVRLD